MIRNNSEYMLEDGSPRYGIRTTGLVAVAEAPALALTRIDQTADAAAMLDGAELKMAVQHRFVLDRFADDAATILSVLEARPDELKVAEEAVAKRFGSPATWMEGAATAYIRTTTEDAGRDGTAGTQLAAMLGSASIYFVGLVLVIGMAVLNVPFLPFMGITAVYWFVAAPFQRRLRRSVDRVALPTSVDREDAKALYDDVVNATLLTVLQHKDVDVDIAISKSLTRGWNHTRYVASVAQDLRTNHAHP